MNALVELHHNEPMTTSLTVAEGVETEHKSVLQLLRRHVGDLGEFGEVAFQMRLNPQGSPTEFAWLNEGQSLFLLTLMRNSPVVVEFKKALIRAFLELRDRAGGAAVPLRDEPLTLSHRADVQVAADRIFRAVLRSGRSAGLRTAHAVRRANALALAKTGIDVLADLEAEDCVLEPALPEGAAAPESDPGAARAFLGAWLACELPLPAIVCRAADLYAAYLHWCRLHGHAPVLSTRFPWRRWPGVKGMTLRIPRPGLSTGNVRIVVPPGGRLGADVGGIGRWDTESVHRFAAALAAWVSAP